MKVFVVYTASVVARLSNQFKIFTLIKWQTCLERFLGAFGNNKMMLGHEE